MKDAKQAVIKMLKNSYANGEITAQEHQDAFDRLKGADIKLNTETRYFIDGMQSKLRYGDYLHESEFIHDIELLINYSKN